MTQDGLRADLRRLLRRNLTRGFSGLLGQSYCYIAPALKPYPFQFFWDTCFHVIMLARLGEHDLAKENLRSLFAMQGANGFVGHMIFWKQVLPKRRTDVMQARPTWQALRPHMSALIQPTFAAIALHTLWEESHDRVYLGEMYARLKRYHEWLAANRDLDGDGLLTIVSPFESGMDWKASYDPVLSYASRVTPKGRLYRSALYWKGVGVDASNFMRRYDVKRIRECGRFLVKDAGFNSIYALDLECMEKLAPLAGDDPQTYGRLRKRVAQSLVERMYDAASRAFFDLQEPGSRKLGILTPTIFFPLAVAEVDAALAARLMEAHFDNAAEFAAPFPLPSVEMRERAFYPGESAFIWRGPTWAPINWFLYHALKKRGYAGQAAKLRRSLWSCIEKSGFREYYDPLTGQGYGARDFTWSGLLVDMD